MKNVLGEIRWQKMSADARLLKLNTRGDNQVRCDGCSSGDGSNLVEQFGQMREPEGDTLEKY